MSEMGHNSGVSGQRLALFIRRIERLEEEKKNISTDIKEVYSEAASSGFDPKIMRQVVKKRKLAKAARQEQEELLRIYMDALGDLADTPLGQSAVERFGV
jgi:uncharacterized protein (UPF0335 family)